MRLSLIYPCVSQRVSLATEQKVGNRSSRVYKVGQAVLLRDLRPTATQKWRAAVISAQQGPFKVVVDGQIRQAHVDHLNISPENNATQEQPNNLQTSDLINSNHYSVPNPFLFTNLEDTDVESTCNCPQSSVETFQWPHCNWATEKFN